MRNAKPWSKLKSRIEDLWVVDLGLAIHRTSYNFPTPGSKVTVSRHWIAMGKAILWDFPGPFLGDDRRRGGPVMDAYPGFANGGTAIGELLREYLDRPKDRLFEPFDSDLWELTDMLRAADRRIGREALKDWSRSLDEDHPCWPILLLRGVDR